ncbi:uncharacterized protein DS421_3g82980 [Arachis hypogaea]|nr:uncharacterized protein DS421_3g82980 [Arachis hypogaea]
MEKLLAVGNSGSLSVSLLQKIHGNLIKEAHDKSRSVIKAPAMKGIFWLKLRELSKKSELG